MPDCRSCKDNRREPVPYIAHEMAMARAERTVKRLVAVVIVMALLLAGTVAGFLVYLSQYDYEGYSQDGEGVNNIVSGTDNRNKVVFYGSEDEGPQTEESLPSEGSYGSEG